ncbi:MAG: bifunctional 3,4-dihydroxy-2-butanone-4-phosphate synthase/GTP cyclohydrolase II [Candidatus Dormibacteria bacterium]
MPLSSIPEAIEDIRQGRFVVVVDDEDRENEGDLTIAAEKVSPEAINFMAKYGRGLICMPVEGQRLDELRIGPMVPENTAPLGTAFCVSIEARHGVSSGISAHDRSETILRVVHPKAKADDFVKPGHTFPLRARDGGVLVRAGQTEAAVDLARLAGLYPAGVICEIMNDDGTMARMPDLEQFSAEHGIRIIAVKDLIAYRRSTEMLVARRTVTNLPTTYGNFTAYGYEDLVNHETHLVLVLGEIDPEQPVLLRAHSECLTGDVFGSQRCDCQEQLHRAMAMIAQEGAGVVLYIRQEGRGIGLHNKLRAYELQDQGLDTVEANEHLGLPADDRDYGIGSQILADVGVRKIRLLSNNPRKYYGIAGYGLEIVERVPLIVEPNEHNRRYLAVKAEKLGHLL